MKRVFQTDYSQDNGNCFQACVASILELQLEDVPHFIQYGEEWFYKFNRWLAKLGYGAIQFELNPLAVFITGLMYTDCILCVPSQKYPGGLHSVVGEITASLTKIEVDISHDPNKNNEPYGSDTEVSDVIVFIKRRPHER